MNRLILRSSFPFPFSIEDILFSGIASIWVLAGGEPFPRAVGK